MVSCLRPVTKESKDQHAKTDPIALGFGLDLFQQIWRHAIDGELHSLLFTQWEIMRIAALGHNGV